jgi:hypothetical protein
MRLKDVVRLNSIKKGFIIMRKQWGEAHRPKAIERQGSRASQRNLLAMRGRDAAFSLRHWLWTTFSFEDLFFYEKNGDER